MPLFHSHLHGGKWSQEEELYAAALIETFKAGELPREDIEKGKAMPHICRPTDSYLGKLACTSLTCLILRFLARRAKPKKVPFQKASLLAQTYIQKV